MPTKKPVVHVGARLPASTHAVYDSPLKFTTDAFCVLPDLEAPFHHADFTNRVLELCNAWGIKDLVLAGDAVHNEALSNWGAKWQENKQKSADDILEIIKLVPQEKREDAIAFLEKSGILQPDSGVSGELAEVRSVFRVLNQQFTVIYYVMGNHEDRPIKRIEAVLDPREWLRLLETGDKWRIAPYYYAIIQCGGKTFRVVHPRPASNTTPMQIAARFGCHVFMAHSHKYIIQHDPSGKYWAAHIGHCVDETRLGYVMQRDRGGWDSHALGAVIVRDGYTYFLSEDSPFEALKRCR